MKVLLLQEILPPYRIPLFNKIVNLKDVDLYVLLFSSAMKNKPEWMRLEYNCNFQVEILKGIPLRLNYERHLHINYNLFMRIFKIKPDVIILCGFYLTSFQAFIFSKMINIPIIIWTESNKYTEDNISLLKKQIRRYMLKKADSIISAGSMATEYLELLNKQPLFQKVYVGYNTVDNSYYYESMLNLKENGKLSKLKYAQKIILYVGQLIERKGLWELINAYKSLNETRKDVALILLGNGPLLNPLKEFCNENDIKNVYFEGFVHQDEIVEFYAIADIFVLLSHYDCNPLVIFEALACGLPIVASYQVGNTPEFVLNDKNGYVVDGKNTAEVVTALEAIINNPEKQKQFGAYSKKLSHNSNNDKTASVFYQAIKETLQD